MLTKYMQCKFFPFLLTLVVLISACQTADTPTAQQKNAEVDSLQSALKRAKEKLDSMERVAQSSSNKDISKKKRPKDRKPTKPTPAKRPPKNEPKQVVVSTSIYTPTVAEPVRPEPTIVTPPPPATTTVSNEINSLKEAIKKEKQALLAAKTKATSADAQALASVTYEEAIALERTAEEKAKGLTSTALKEAKEHFSSAKELFQKAAEEAAFLMAAQLEADKSKEAMLAMRRNIGNGSRNPSTLASYKEAIVMEKQGDKQYEASEFKAASKAYVQAEILYKTTKETLAKQPKQSTNSKKQNTTKIEERKIQIKIDNYGELLEVGDIQGLLQEGYISAKERNAWSTLFSNVENMTIKITNKTIAVKGNKATTSFSVKMHYQNKSSNKVEESSFSKNWELIQKNDRWLIQ